MTTPAPTRQDRHQRTATHDRGLWITVLTTAAIAFLVGTALVDPPSAGERPDLAPVTRQQVLLEQSSDQTPSPEPVTAAPHAGSHP